MPVGLGIRQLGVRSPSLLASDKDCDCLRLLAPNLSGSLSLWRPNDECASGGFDDVFGDGVEVVDSQDAVDLGEEAVE